MVARARRSRRGGPGGHGKAGYDPREAPKTFQVLLEEYGDKGTVENFFYGSHPTNEARIAHLNQLIQSNYADAGKDRTSPREQR